MNPLYSVGVRTIDGREEKLDAYAGKVLLIVNVASKCGFTPQYRGLEALYRQYRAKGLEILGFPCDQFGHQEPGDAAEIQNFCSLNYDVSFPLFEKTVVNGDNTHPLYDRLKNEARGLLGTKAIKWNFTKFLVNRQGKTVRRYPPTARPESLSRDIDRLL